MKTVNTTGSNILFLCYSNSLADFDVFCSDAFSLYFTCTFHSGFFMALYDSVLNNYVEHVMNSCELENVLRKK